MKFEQYTTKLLTHETPIIRELAKYILDNDKIILLSIDGGQITIATIHSGYLLEQNHFSFALRKMGKVSWRNTKYNHLTTAEQIIQGIEDLDINPPQQPQQFQNFKDTLYEAYLDGYEDQYKKQKKYFKLNSYYGKNSDYYPFNPFS